MNPAANSPWYKTTLSYSAFGQQYIFDVPYDVFSNHKIDEGTQLLHEHLPSYDIKNTPQAILDMGCGYGALGIPLASLFPKAQLDLVDRDLLAVEWAKINTQKNNLLNVNAYGSLGFVNVPRQKKYDWILCNIPARIGKKFIEDFFENAKSRLNPKGEIRVVVILDLCPVLNELPHPPIEVARGSKHAIFKMVASSDISFDAVTSDPPKNIEQEQIQELYTRDTVQIEGLNFLRPFDLGGDDPKRLTQGLPVLFDVLPKKIKPQASVFCWRAGYGQIPLVFLSKFPDAQVTICERDLLGELFLKFNAKNLNCPLRRVETSASILSTHAHSNFDYVLGELSPAVGEVVTYAECCEVLSFLAPQGEALLLMLNKIEREWVRHWKFKGRIQKVLTRGDYTVLRITH